ncbi:MAG: substrate-binding domain-containing protein [Oscillospiraceae bacterium]|nr:substrate-binding domain-containing protein [Oscillospiraceae bacterium]
MKKKSRTPLARTALCSLALAVCLSSTGCGLIDGAANGAVDLTGARVYVIGSSKGLEFWDYVKQGAMEAGEELGYEVIYKTAEQITDIDTQRKLIREAINDGAKSIVIAPNDPDALNDDLQAAVQAGIEVLAIDADTTFTGRRTYIGTSNVSSGSIAARHAFEFFNNMYDDKAIVVTDSDTALSAQDRLSGFQSTLESLVRAKALTEYNAQRQAEAQQKLEEMQGLGEDSGLPPAVLNPAKSAAYISSQGGASPDDIAQAVANAAAAGASSAGVDVETTAKAAELAASANGGNGERAAQLVREIMTGEKKEEKTEETVVSVDSVDEAAQAAAKAAKDNGAPAAAIAEAAANAAAQAAIDAGSNPGIAARAAGQAAGMYGGDSQAASQTALAIVQKATGQQQETPQQDNTTAAEADPQVVSDAAQAAAKSAKENGAPAAAIAEAAANAAAQAAIENGIADPGVAGQAAGQAAGMNGGDAQAAGAAAAEAVSKAIEDGTLKAGGDTQQGGNTQESGSAEIPEEVAKAAQAAARTAAAQGAPPAGIAQAAANAAATTCIEMGITDPSIAAQAAGQAAGPNGGDSSLAASTAVQAILNATGEGTSTTKNVSTEKIEPIQTVLNCKGESDVAKQQVLQLLSNDTNHNIKVIFTTSERSTIGACEAVAEANMVGKVAIIGYNANETEQTYLKNGTLTGLIVQNPYNMGYLGVYYSGRLLSNDNVGRTIDTGAAYVTLSNLNSNEIKLLLDPAGYTRK